MSDTQAGWRQRVGGFVMTAYAWGNRSHALWHPYARAVSFASCIASPTHALRSGCHTPI